MSKKLIKPKSSTKTISTRKPLNPRFVSVRSSKSVIRQREISKTASPITSRSPSKDKITIQKREFSLEEEQEIESMIQDKLSESFVAVKKKINSKFKKLRNYRLFPDDMNALRAESLVAVETKKMYGIFSEIKILPKLKRQAKNEILFKRKSKPLEDKFQKRMQALERINGEIVSKEPDSFRIDKRRISEEYMQDYREKLKNCLERYSVLPCKHLAKSEI
ncbi:hypothetical protein SteCoe_16598 [Stentor coeruleus]|uniref:Uncharacterized protein n=1 Tax=Stentor coeruleus TaxID=5963 RepID=A0A1R2C0X3_9CILI|nr:hypothetical protein SteCoe_16598 [Stentor coeruleus]